jgi:hypothetical protein
MTIMEVINNTKDLYKNIYSRAIRLFFLRYIRLVRSTPPIDNFDNNSNIILLSMVQKKDVDMLLMAVKSFVRFVKIQKIVIVADPTLDETDMSLISQHLVNVDFIPSNKMTYTDAPRGGCWERLISIADINNQGYVIQLDADTLTFKSPIQVLHALECNVSFTLGTKLGQKPVSCDVASSTAKELISKDISHIQVLSESMLDELPGNYKFYIRGCAGFSGFAKDTLNRDKIFELSSFYYKKIGKRWDEWGSEQFASNLLIANSPNNEVLNLKDYDVPIQKDNSLCFHHYIGTVRFTSFLYFLNAKKIINELYNSEECKHN